MHRVSIALTLALAILGPALPREDAALEQAELERMAEEIKAEIEGLRGARFQRPVAVELADGPTFRRYVAERMARTETPESLRAQADVAHLLGLLPPGVDMQEELERMLESQVGGFYDPSTDTFYLMETFTGDLARMILAHELVHALDDQLWDIDGTLERVATSSDSELAYHGLVEGSATLAGFAWAMKHMGELDPAALDEGGMALPPLDAPPFLWKPLLAAYMRGLAFVQKGEKRGDDSLARAFANPPRSTEQVLHPDKYWNPKKLDEPRAIELASDALPEGWQLLEEDTLGELLAALVVEPWDERGGIDPTNALAMLGVKYTRPAAEGWGGDRLALLGKGEARALRWVTLWDTDEDAREFEDALREIGPPADSGLTWTIRSARVQDGTEGARDWVVLDVLGPDVPEDLELPSWRESEPAEGPVR